jgi:hypothetical protein
MKILISVGASPTLRHAVRVLNSLSAVSFMLR